MTIEERKERFFKFEGCIGTACSECSYHNPENRIRTMNCQDQIHEDAKLIMKHSAGEQAIKEIARPTKFETPLTGKEREQIKELIRVKTEVPDLSAHFIQEINELCAELNGLAAILGKLEQLRKGTDPVGEEDNNAADLIYTVGICVSRVIEEAADVINYLWVTGEIDNDYHVKIEGIRNEKLARWANRLNGVSDE